MVLIQSGTLTNLGFLVQGVRVRRDGLTLRLKVRENDLTSSSQSTGDSSSDAHHMWGSPILPREGYFVATVGDSFSPPRMVPFEESTFVRGDGSRASNVAVKNS